MLDNREINKDEYMAYVRWYIKPSQEKSPASIFDYLLLTGLEMEDIKAFESLPNFPEDVYSETMRYAKLRIPLYLNNLHEAIIAKPGKSDLLKIFSDLIRQQDEKSKGNTNNFLFFGDITPEKLQRIATRITRAPELPHQSGAI